MSPNNHVPTFNMKVVVQETGLKPDTLRAWERRYGVPNPQRTQGGHRLYSQHEIDMLKWLVARQSEGMSISHAIDRWRQLEKDGQNPLASMDTVTAEPTVSFIDGERVDDLRNAWIEACLAFNEYQAQHLLARAFALFPLETVCYKILQQGLNEIGEGWYQGRYSVQQEHFASALALRQLEALLAALPAPTKNGRIIVACPPLELHTFSPLIISLMLRRQGWDVVYLGANVPLERMEASVRQIEPQLVIMPAQTLIAAANLLPTAQKLQKMNVPLAFGGIVFNRIPQAKNAIPGHFLGESLAQAPEKVEKLLQSKPPIGKVTAASPNYVAAFQHFIEQRSSIEAKLHQLPELSAVSTPFLKHKNEELGNNIEAALQLGDLAMVSSNLGWVDGLLAHNPAQVSNLTLAGYLQAYHNVLASVLDQRGAPLLEWFASLN